MTAMTTQAIIVAATAMATAPRAATAIRAAPTAITKAMTMGITMARETTTAIPPAAVTIPDTEIGKVEASTNPNVLPLLPPSNRKGRVEIKALHAGVRPDARIRCQQQQQPDCPAA